ncbi:MAG: dihydrodipicolinate synthase family protein [Nitriliruptoraceae bacterium]
MTHFPGVYVATTTAFTADGALDLATYRDHCRWLIDSGIDGLVPNGSLGEYESLSDDERHGCVEAAIEVAAEASGGRVKVVPGVSAPGSHQSLAHARHAAEAGAAGVMALPPVIHNATREEVIAHFAQIARAGLPIIAYNNPFSTKKDLTPDLYAELAEIDEVVAVKEFSGDARRVLELKDTAPELEILCGADDLALESALLGATGWISGFSGALPGLCGELWALGREGRLTDALPRYEAALPLLRWDTGPRFVQAIKLTQELVGQPMGPTRPPRLPLPDADQAVIRQQLDRALGVA